MISPTLERIGAQVPTVEHLPPNVHSSAGREAADLAESVGLVLDDWQRRVLIGALSERTDGRWAAFEVGVVCPRQNGKNAILEAVELAGLFLFGEQLIVHSAHQFDTATAHFLRMQELIESSRDLSSKVRQVLTANGKEAIVLRSGARLKFKARSRGGSRGLTGDRVVLDEAYDLPPKAIGAMIPALAARSLQTETAVQVWYTSSAPHADSQVLHGVRERGTSSNGGRLYYAEWSAPDETDPWNRDAWYATNPGLGIRIAEEFVGDELASMGATAEGLVEWKRERLGIPDGINATPPVIPADVWRARADTGSQVAGNPVYGLSVNPDRDRASTALAGANVAGLVHVEVTGTYTTPGSTVADLAGRTVVVDPSSPAGSLIGDLERAGCTVVEVSGRQWAQACNAWYDDVIERRLVHVAQGVLDEALAGARKRVSGDAWVWDRRAPGVDITPLDAVTLARWGLVGLDEPADWAY